MRPARRTALFVLASAAALAAGYLGYRWDRRDQPDIGPLMAVGIADLDGNIRSLPEWHGKVLVVNFWATWCPPCLKEIPDFVKMQEKLGAKGLQFVGIAADQPEKVRDFAAKYQMNYPVLLADMGIIEIARQAGNRAGGLPFTVILDRQGHWIRSESGALDEEKLGEMIAPLL